MGNRPFGGSFASCFRRPWYLRFWTRHMPSYHVIFLICRGKTQCPLIPLVKLTGVPGSCPVTVSLQQSLAGVEPGRGRLLTLSSSSECSLSCELSKCQPVPLILLHRGRSSRKPGEWFANRNTTRISWNLCLVQGQDPAEQDFRDISQFSENPPPSD